MDASYKAKAKGFKNGQKFNNPQHITLENRAMAQQPHHNSAARANQSTVDSFKGKVL